MWKVDPDRDGAVRAVEVLAVSGRADDPSQWCRSGHCRRRYRCLVSGAKRQSTATKAATTQPIWPAVAVPAMRPRSAATRWLIGLASTKGCSQPGIVRGSTKMLLANARGKTNNRLTFETALGVRRTSASAVQIHAMLNENPSSSATASSTPTGPPSGRKPMATPIAMTIAAASRFRAASPTGHVSADKPSAGGTDEQERTVAVLFLAASNTGATMATSAWTGLDAESGAGGGHRRGPPPERLPPFSFLPAVSWREGGAF